MTLPSHLPPELHAEILQGLHHYRDRSTLVSTALVSKEWSKQSQRILFSKMHDHWYTETAQQARAMVTHIGFLSTIAAYPDRLGPLVHSYAQHHLAVNAAATSRWSDFTESHYDLWMHMERALPVMINLQHLYVAPVADVIPAVDGWVSSAALFQSFTFQLKTLTWRAGYHPHHGFSEFLATQNSLTHLGDIRLSDEGHMTWLGHNVCPHLVSMAGGFDSLNHVAQSRDIIAWKCDLYETGLVPPESLALGRLKYLSICDYKSFRDTVGPSDLNIILLELEELSWAIDPFASLSNMPKLRVLVILRHLHRILSKEALIQIATDSFSALPSLEYIIHRDFNETGDEYRYVKLTMPPNLAGDILQEELMMEYDIGLPWWTIYDV